MRIMHKTATLIFTLACLASADNDFEDTAAAGEVSITGRIEFDIAEMLKARTSAGGSSNPGEAKTVDHIWHGHTIGSLKLESNPTEYVKLCMSFEFRQFMSILPLLKEIRPDPFFGQSSWNAFSVREGQGILSLINNGSLSFEMAFGYMPFKYNPEVRDLGEFLFRSGTYPLYLLGDFDRPFARLTGLRASFSYGNAGLGANFDALALTEREIRPFWDISLAGIASAHFFKMIDIGAGADFAHLVPMDSRITTPDTNLTSYIIDSTEALDSSTGQPLGIWQYNYGHYTFKGTKLMMRATIDPFGTVRGKKSIVSDIVGKNGGKIYAEAAIIGLENYPANLTMNPVSNPFGYDKLKEKMPWMVGISMF